MATLPTVESAGGVLQGTSYYTSLPALIKRNPYKPERDAALSEGRINFGRPPNIPVGATLVVKEDRYFFKFKE